MRVTTAGDLLARADHLTRELISSEQDITADQWAQFDITVYRGLYELIGGQRADPAYTEASHNALLQALRAYPAPLRLPAGRTFSVDYAAQLLDVTHDHVVRRIREGTLHAVKEGNLYLLPTKSLDTGHRDIGPADPTDPAVMARLSVTLGALADLVCDNNNLPHPVELGDEALTGAVRQLLAVAAVAGRHTITHTPIDDIDRPLLIARYASTQVDLLDPSPRRVRALDHVAAAAPGGEAMPINRQLDAALDAWRRTAHHEVNRMVPSVQALSSIANQGVRLYAVTHQLVRSAPCLDGDPANRDKVMLELQEGAASLRAAQEALTGLTSLTTPTHDFVTATRELFTTLQRVRELATSNDPSLDADATLASLQRGCSIEAELVINARRAPISLLHCGLLFAPARTLQPTLERLPARTKGRYIAVQLADAPDLGWRWETAARKVPEVAAALRGLELRQHGVGRDHGIELGH
jgi:excisionase family DNA binding protein